MNQVKSGNATCKDFLHHLENIEPYLYSFMILQVEPTQNLARLFSCLRG